MSDNKLNPASSEFDPLLAIYNPDPSTNEDSGVVHDNVEKCIAVLEGRVATASKKKPQKPADEPSEKLERQFLPEQMPVAGKRKEFRHVLARMGEFASGPLAKLKQWMETKTRVRVWTRGVNNVRGVSTGFLIAFDKHWNLALQDVDEQFSRKASRKVPATGEEGRVRQKATPCGVGQEYKMGFSLVRVVERRGKSEVCNRHVDQVLLRGEHVVMVASLEVGSGGVKKGTESCKEELINPTASTSHN